MMWFVDWIFDRLIYWYRLIIYFDFLTDSEGAFWPLLFTLRVLMQKLESTFWLLTNFDDAPATTFRVILQHRTLTDVLTSLADRCVILTGDSHLHDGDDNDEEISLSQLSEKHDDGVGDAWDEGHHKCRPFFWVLPYIVTVLDLEDLSSQVIGDVLVYLISLVQPSKLCFSSHYTYLPNKIYLFCLTH